MFGLKRCVFLIFIGNKSKGGYFDISGDERILIIIYRLLYSISFCLYNYLDISLLVIDPVIG